MQAKLADNESKPVVEWIAMATNRSLGKGAPCLTDTVRLCEPSGTAWCWTMEYYIVNGKLLLLMTLWRQWKMQGVAKSTTCFLSLPWPEHARSKCPEDFHPISSWYHRNVYPTCFSQLRSPPLMAYQSAIHESTNCSPAKPFFGIYLWLPIDLLLGYPLERKWTREYSIDPQWRMERIYCFAHQHLWLTSDRWNRGTICYRRETSTGWWCGIYGCMIFTERKTLQETCATMYL